MKLASVYRFRRAYHREVTDLRTHVLRTVNHRSLAQPSSRIGCLCIAARPQRSNHHHFKSGSAGCCSSKSDPEWRQRLARSLPT
jgi:hypothetical protein